MYYELVSLLSGSLSPLQVEKMSNQFRELVESMGGEVTKVEFWGLRSLAYKINKQRHAHYCLYNLKVSYECLQELQRQISLNQSVLRYFTLKIDQPSETPSLMMQNIKSSDRDINKTNSKENAESQSTEDNTETFSIDYKNINLLKRSISERGRIMPRRLTGLNLREQHKLARAIKHARFLGLLSASSR